MGCNNSKINDDGRYNCKVSGDECVYLMPNKEQCFKDGYINSEKNDLAVKVDIDNITYEIIKLLKEDYLFDVDYDEEQGLRSDIVDILSEHMKALEVERK